MIRNELVCTLQPSPLKIKQLICWHITQKHTVDHQIAAESSDLVCSFEGGTLLSKAIRTGPRK